MRTLERDGEIWFVAKDVAEILGYRDAANATRLLDDDEKDTHKVSTLRISEGTSPKGGNPNVNIINEPGLYKLAFRSNMPVAKKFTK